MRLGNKSLATGLAGWEGSSQIQEQQHPRCNRYDRRGTYRYFSSTYPKFELSTAARMPAIEVVTQAHRLPGVVVGFLFDTLEVTFLFKQETYRLATPTRIAWTNLAC